MRYLFLFLFSTCAQLTFAQENGETTFEHPCFKQLLVTVKNYGYLKDNKAYGWGIKIKNNYKAPVSFTYALLVGDESRGNGQPTYTISPGDTWAADWGRLTLLLKSSSSTEFRVPIWGLCFKGYDCSDDNYFDCDGQQIKDKMFGSNWRTKNNQNSSQSNTTSSTTNTNNYNTAVELVNKKNDLCAQLGKLLNGASNNVYALCQAQTYTANDINILKTQVTQLEAEITRLQNNAAQSQQQQTNQQAQQARQQQIQQEYQRIAQENAQRAEKERQDKIQVQQQQYDKSVNQAKTSMRGGDFAGAMQGYANAANSATSSSDRKYATAGAVISGLAGIADAWQKSAQARRERKEAEKQLANARAAEQLDTDWKKANELASDESNSGYQSAINIMLSYASESKLNGAALNTIGIWYWNLKKYDSARHWFIRADIEGDVNAMFNMGVLYENGQGVVAKDFKKAAEYYKEACDKQYEPACKKAIEMNEKVAAVNLEIEKLKPVETSQAADDTVTVQTIINRYIAAIGGYEQIKAIKMVEQLEEGENLTIKTIRGYSQYYSEIKIENALPSKTVFNGSTGYNYSSFTGTLDTNAVALYKKTQPFEILALPQQELMVGKIESLKGTGCYTLMRAPYTYGSSTITYTYYFSKSTGLYAGMKFFAASKNYNSTTYYFYDDYQPVGGVLFPFSRITSSPKNVTLNKFTVKQININNPASQEYFK